MNSQKKSVYKRIFALAIPVSIGQAGNIVANIADTLMLGRHDSNHMVACATGFQVFVMPLVFLIGMTIALSTVVAKHEGEGTNPKILGSALFTYFFSGLLITVLIYVISYNLEWFHPEEQIQNLAAPYLQWLGLSIVPIVFFLTLKQYFEGYELSLITTIVSLISNGINIVLNYGLIFGNWGFEARGVEGAGFATFLSKVFALPLFFLAIWLFKKYRIKYKQSSLTISRKKCLELLKLGIPMGFQIFVEVVAFACAGIMTGWISIDAQGAHQIALQLAAFTFLIAGGFGSAATVLISQFYGEKNRDGVKEVMRKSLILVFFYEIFTCILFLIFSNNLPPLFLKKEDIEMIIIAGTLIKMAAIFQIPDGLQNTLHGVLRGLQDTTWPTYLSIGSHWVITLLGGYYLAFHTSYGVVGIWIGFIAGLSLLAILLSLRVKHVLKKARF